MSPWIASPRIEPVGRGWTATVIAVLAAIAVGMAGAAADGPLSAEDAAFFEARVRPLFVEHCAECHSGAAGEPEGGLSFDSRADFFAADGVAVAGKPDDSVIIQAVRYDGDLQMPPSGRLPAEAIATLEEWVRRGLPWPADGKQAARGGFDLDARRAEHWCWQPPVAGDPPAVADPGWCRGEIDRFVLARLEKAGLQPVPEAPRTALVRRAAEVLTGLPPDPADVERIASDPDPAAFDRYVDTLLASPHYGERFARHWLDIVRYAETRGHEFDFPIPNAWRYRDWVIRAFNADLPYDRFVTEQVAGDLVAPPRLDGAGADESVQGTGFWFLGEEVHSPVDIQQDEADRIDNRVDTFGKAFLGLPLGCARCHDHKFDAISAADYYALAGTVLSASYRQVPFESLPANRIVAERLAAADPAERDRLLPLVGRALAARPEAEVIGRLRARLATVAAAVAADGAAVTIADYTAPDTSPALLCDGVAWRHLPAGQPLPRGDGRGITLLPHGAAHCDAVWSRMTSAGERDPGGLGGLDRAGRVLRTPKTWLTQGVLWHRVRGHVQIFACIDGHVMVLGPLYGATVTSVDTQGQWRWVRQDLRSAIDWSRGHLVHVEYAAVAGPVDVAEVVAAPEEPRRADPLAAEVARRSAAGAGPDGDAVLGALMQEVIAACSGGGGAGPASAPLVAEIVNTVLADPATDWTGGDAGVLAAAAGTVRAEREAIAAEARLASAIAPAMLDGNGIDQAILLKGSAARRGAAVPRRFLEAIDGRGQPPFPAAASGRMELAARLVDPANPLTSRVIVNRVWHWLFGRGLVATPDNFGRLGEAPVDPLAQALLDRLAVRFQAEGWSLKRLIREIVVSSTWRMSSVARPEALAADPLNHLLHHAPLRRLEGEAIRDTILAVSGRLDRTVGGAPVEVHLAEYHEGRGKPASGPLDGAGRRSLYTKIRRNFLPAFQLAFDMPVPFQAMGRRNVTNVPAQALVLMNDPFVMEQARLWARRTLADSAAGPRERIAAMYRDAFARPPRPDEIDVAAAFLAAQAALHGADFVADPRHEGAWADLAHALFNAKEFVYLP